MELPESDWMKEANDQIQRSLNNAKRQELTEKFGLSMQHVKPDLDPEVEASFLNYLEEWERANVAAVQTTVWEFLGKPEINRCEGLSEDEMVEEIDRIYQVMEDNQMALDCINDIPIAELHDFVTGDFMKVECSDMRIPEMTHRFIYEEFFPEKYPFDDSEYDVLKNKALEPDQL